MTEREAMAASARELARAVMLRLYAETGRATEAECGVLLGVSKVAVCRWLSGQRGMGERARRAAWAYLEAGNG